MNIKEIREITNNCVSNTMTIEEIEALIREEASEGCSKATLKGTISEQISKILIQDGFELHNYTAFGKNYTTIEW